MRGFPTRRGSRMIDPVPDTEDGPAVARLREAGAVILGKTTTPEFGWKAIGDLPADRHHPQPVEPRAHAGRQQRRRRRRLRRRHRAAACRQRRGRLDPHPVLLYRHFRHQGDIRAGAGASGLADGPVVECRADDAQRARRGADAEHAGAARPSRPVCAAARAPAVSRRHRGRRAGLADRLQPRSRLCPQSRSYQSRSRDRRLRCQGGAAIRGAGRACRAGRPDLRLAAPDAADPVGGRHRARHGRLPDGKARDSPIPA